MKKLWLTPIIWIAIFCFPNLLNAQKELSIDQAVLGFGMYPDAPLLSWQGADLIEMKDQAWYKYSHPLKESDLYLDLKGLNELLMHAGFGKLARMPRPDFIDDGRIRIQTGGSVILLDQQNASRCQEISFPASAENMSLSPDYNQIAFTRGNNIYITDRLGRIVQVTHDSLNGIVNGQAVSRSEFGITGGLFWSPSGRYLAFYQKDESEVASYPLVHIHTRIATMENIPYPMAGETSERVSVGIYDVWEKSTRFIEDHSFGPDQYLTNISWDPSEAFIYSAVLNREQDHLKLNKYEVLTGQILKTLFEETSNSYVEPLRGLYFLPHNPDCFIWFSDRDGYDHMYLYNSQGELLDQLTSGNFMVTDLLGWDRKGRYLYFVSTEESPLELHAYQLDTKSGKKRRLTPEPGTHQVVFNPDRSFFTDTYSNLESPSKTCIGDAFGKSYKMLSQAENPLKEFAIGDYQGFTIKAGDGTTDLFGYYILPPDFDPEKKYPLLVYVYGGPHAQLVHNEWLGGARAWQYYMAQRGYVALTLDNRGSSGRGRDFEHVIHRQLGVAEMEDQIAGVNYLKSLGFIDENRIGVHGWSYGGFMTTNLMLSFPDVFKVGVAGGPVIDWKYYEVMYGERYMDTPQENPEGYAAADLSARAGQLKGRLMLIHGTIDPTVVWQNSLGFVESCIQKKVLIDYMVYPEHPHNVRGVDRVHLMRTVSRYFEDHL